jgi:tetraacyldisaccharide 4'-kinase
LAKLVVRTKVVFKDPSLGDTWGMYSRTQLLEIISGKRTGLAPAMIRLGLGCLTPVYRLAIFFRNRKYRRAIQQHDETIVKQAEIPVISVGNLTTGGTGKTPLVIWIANHLRQHQLRVVLISRGYGAENNSTKSGRNDEAMELEHRLPDVPHLQDPNRYRMAQIAVEELESQVIVLDDAFQHQAIHRDLNLVLIDATAPFGFDRLLPRGLLREPISSLKRADLIILTRANLISDAEQERIALKIQQHSGKSIGAATQTVVSCLWQSDGSSQPAASVKRQSVFVFCGVGNPESFQRTVESLGTTVVDKSYFKDHHTYTRDDLTQIGRLANDSGAQTILCTHKDLVKLGVNQIGGLPVFAVLIDIEFITGQLELESRLDQVMANHG